MRTPVNSEHSRRTLPPMERKRIDLAGGPSKATAKPGRAGGAGAAPADKKKNMILLSVAGVAFVVAAYFIYANYFTTPAAPVAATPEIESTFTEAAKVPPPAADSQPMPEPGIGKRLNK